MTNEIIRTIKKSGHPMTEIMVAYLQGKNHDEMVLNLIINTLELSGNYEQIVWLLK